jgi:hypothetical protein
MSRLPAFRSLCVAAIVALSAFVGADSALAGPANDNFGSPTEVTPIPFSQSGDLNGATIEPNEPIPCFGAQQTTWYHVTVPSTMALRVAVTNASFNVFTAGNGGIESLGFIGCASQNFEFVATSATSYYIQVLSFFPVQYHVDVTVVPPPLNDNFEDAASIDSLPFTDTVDLIAATLQTGEPIPGGFNASAWYVVNPSSPGRLSVSLNSFGPCCSFPFLAVYTGSAFNDLSLVGQRGPFSSPLTFFADPASTYYIQVSAAAGTAAMASIQVIETPPIVPNFFYQPFDPSTVDTIQFFDQTNDPVQAGFQSWAWQFGDGTSGTGNLVTKTYAKDGDYNVVMTVTTVDGRTGTATQTVHVRTHDVAIVKLTVPKSASAGQTRDITVGIRNYRYPEMVQVQLYKSVPGQGFQLIGTLTQLIPVRNGNGTTPVSFSYTFTGDDAAVGKVSFQAVVSMLGARDVLPADNTAISPPTKVSR